MLTFEVFWSFNVILSNLNLFSQPNYFLLNIPLELPDSYRCITLYLIDINRYIIYETISVGLKHIYFNIKRLLRIVMDLTVVSVDLQMEQ
jgi:hypothetical protein